MAEKSKQLLNQALSNSSDLCQKSVAINMFNLPSKSRIDQMLRSQQFLNKKNSESIKINIPCSTTNIS